MMLPVNTTVGTAENKLGSRQHLRQRRRLEMCRGQGASSMLEEMMKGANMVIAGDSGMSLCFRQSGVVDCCAFVVSCIS